MHGVVNFLKPPGMTSHDAVALLRRRTGVKRIGHTGTLDPAAAGVLPLCVGQATRLVEYLQEGTKEYVAELAFGYETDTCDAMGQIVATGSCQGLAKTAVMAVLPGFLGDIEQLPPLFSAIKHDGKKLYELARAGATEDQVGLQPRTVTIGRLALERFREATSELPARAMLRVGCGGGTYIRSLVRDIGRALGCYATMSFLVRTRNGHFPIAEAATVEEIAGDIANFMMPMSRVLPWCVDVVIENPAAATRLAQGQVVVLDAAQVPSRSLPRPRVLVRDEGWTMASIAAPVGNAPDTYRAVKVLDLRSASD